MAPVTLICGGFLFSTTMETLHQIINESVSGGLWRFLGYYLMIALILGIPARLIAFLWNRMLRYFTMKKNGFPPHYCDADGDLVGGENK